MDTNQHLWGWNPKLDIPSALSRTDQSELTKSYALITVVDSSPRVTEMVTLTPLLEKLDAFHDAVGRSVVVEFTTLFSISENHEFFDGFDEIWLFDEIPTDPKPDAVPLTSDVRLQQTPSRVLSEWMQSNGGFAGLGDGDGLNWMTTDPSLAQLWAA